MPKVSILMPSLNVVKYIEQCIESVVNQTLRDMEILVIDAGSTDGTLDILREYEARDQRVRLIHSERKSYGYQLNLGISMAQGDYIGVVETDDFIDADMYQTLYDLAVRSEADYVKGAAEHFYELLPFTSRYHKFSPFAEEKFKQSRGIITISPNLEPDILLKDYYLWWGLYKRELVKQVHLNETPGAAYQDIGFLLQTYRMSQKALYINKPFYHYRQDNPHASTGNQKGFHYLAQEYGYVKNLLERCDPIWRTLCNCKMFRQTVFRFQLMAQSGSFWDDAVPYIRTIIDRLKEETGFDRCLSPNEFEILEILFQNPVLLYDYYKERIEKKKNEAAALLHQISQQEEVIIFGGGNWGIFAHIFLTLQGIKTVCTYCDNNQSLWQSNLQGLPVLSPEQAVKTYPEAQYIIASKSSGDQMAGQLMELGVASSHITTYTLGTDPLLLRMQFKL